MSTPEPQDSRRAGHRHHHDVPLPPPADGLRCLRRRSRQLVLPHQLSAEGCRRRGLGGHRLDARDQRGHRGRVREPGQERRSAGHPTAGPAAPSSSASRVGSTATSLHVSVTDPSATRYFSQVFRGDQSLSRTAEAEYNMPLPLGSPLNYFGGDRSQIAQPTEQYQRIDWPADYTTRVPANRPCNPGTTAEGGGWSATTWSGTGFNGATRGVSGRPCSSRPAPPTTTRRQVRRRTSLATPPPRATAGGSTTPRATRHSPSGTRVLAGPLQRRGTGSASGPSPAPPVRSPPSTAPRTGATEVASSPTGASEPRMRPLKPTPSSATPPLGTSSAAGHLTRPPRLAPYQAGRTRSPPTETRGSGRRSTVRDSTPRTATRSRPGAPTCTLGSIQNEDYVDTDEEDRGYWYVIDVPAGVAGIARHQRVRRVLQPDVHQDRGQHRERRAAVQQQ